MTQEQLIQEARKEAEKVYTEDLYMPWCIKTKNINDAKKEGYIDCYIQQAEKRKREAVAFTRFIRSVDGANLLNQGRSLEMCYDLFLQQLKQE